MTTQTSARIERSFGSPEDSAPLFLRRTVRPSADAEDYDLKVYEILKQVNYIVTITFFICYFYQFLYIPLVLFFRKRHEKKIKAARGEITLHDFAILICARNEEVVIGDLIESLHNQSYPQDRLSIFVIADNCTDETARIAGEHGARVYVRQNDKLIGKGYALNELFGHLRVDYPADRFDGYFVFDADNVLAKDYIERMNESFCDGNDVITSYRNTKNYGSNWVSSGYGMWFLRESRYLNNARKIIGSSSNISGTGFLVARSVIEENGGWPFHLLTEDIEFSIDRIVKGKKVAICLDAEVFDEQPTSFRQSWRQRKRWSRGYLQVLRKYFFKLIKGIFHGSFSCFDVLMNIAPAYLLTIISVVCNVAMSVICLVTMDMNQPMEVLQAVGSTIQLLFSFYWVAFICAIVTLITEWKHIRASAPRKIWSVFTFPLFMLTFVPISIAALFTKTTWKPIQHTQSLQKMKEDGNNVSF